MYLALLTLGLNYTCAVTDDRNTVGSHLLLLFRYLRVLSSNLLLESSDSNMNNNSRLQPIYGPILFLKVAAHRFRRVSALPRPGYFGGVKVLWNCNKTTAESSECI